MKKTIGRYARSQDGFTLVELIVASVIGVAVMTALTSVVLTTNRSVNAATNRIEASGQIRNFELFAYDDFAQSGVPVPGACGTAGNPCTTQPLPLSGTYGVSYVWDGSAFLDRQVGGNSIHMATNVTAFSWYVDMTPLHPTVVISLTVTVPNASDLLAYSDSQTFRFVPQVNP